MSLRASDLVTLILIFWTQNANAYALLLAPKAMFEVGVFQKEKIRNEDANVRRWLEG